MNILFFIPSVPWLTSLCMHLHIEKDVLYCLLHITHTILPTGFLSTATTISHLWEAFCDVLLYLIASMPHLLCRNNIAHTHKGKGEDL